LSDLSEATSAEDNIYAGTPTDILKEMLRYSAFSDEALDLESTRMMLGELKKREPGIPQKTPEEALGIFNSEYSGNESAFMNCAFDEGAQTKKTLKDVAEKNRIPNYVDAATGNEGTPQKNSHGKAHGKSRRQIRLLYRVAVAAALTILVTLFFTSTALGGHWLQSIVQWGRETFKFVDDDAPVSINEELVTLHNALADCGITGQLAPTWLPDGFVLVEFNVSETLITTTLLFHFQNGSRDLVIQIVSLNYSIGATYEKTGEATSIYIRNEIEHHIIENEGNLVVVWKNMDYECIISGDITVGEAEIIINSIYEG